MDAKRLTRLLTARGLVERFAVEQALVRLSSHERLEDRLVSEGMLTENDLLRAIAQETKTRFVSSERLLDLRVPALALEFIPRETAEALDVLPIAWDGKAHALAVVLADLSQLPKLEDLPGFNRVETLVANIALPSAIRLAVRRAYGKRAGPRPKPKPIGACSHCATSYFQDQLECTQCGLLLNADARHDGSDAQIVRALLSQPTGLHRIPTKEALLEGPTRRGFAVEVTDGHVPTLLADVGIARTLSELEAFFISFIDGALTLEELGQSSGLMGVEVRSVAASLTQRGLIELSLPEDLASYQPPPPPPATPPPIVAGVPVSSPGPAFPERSRAKGVERVGRPPGGRLPGGVKPLTPIVRGTATDSSTFPAVPPPVVAGTLTESSKFPAAPPPGPGKLSADWKFPAAPQPVVAGKLTESATPASAPPPAPGKLSPDWKFPAAPRPGFAGKSAEQAAPPARAAPLEQYTPRHLTPEGQVENSLQSALALERRGEVAGAIAVLKVAIGRAPNAAALYNRLGLVVLNQRKDARQAEELIQKAIALEPDNVVFQQNLAKVLMAAASGGKKR